ncbi:hypothetical protein GCM10009733_009770 [Nonomuraea maheshkhaliensis]|uniref:Uncharacterized protein n=1 Tax=Nonomuraea maheshkhaliensis TaxID=419590 RepID=A0ABN2ERL9_9ACTN
MYWGVPLFPARASPGVVSPPPWAVPDGGFPPPGTASRVRGPTRVGVFFRLASVCAGVPRRRHRGAVLAGSRPPSSVRDPAITPAERPHHADALVKDASRMNVAHTLRSFNHPLQSP